MPYDAELIDTEDIYENDDVVLMKAMYKLQHFNLEVISAGVKDNNGDIVKIIELTQKAV